VIAPPACKTVWFRRVTLNVIHRRRFPVAKLI